MSLRERLQNFGRPSGDNAPRVAATAFGKHPGWDDHIDDIGLDTNLLAETKRWLYVEGIRAIVDNGTWEKLEEDQQLDKFDHIFLWRVGDDLVLGRLWSSRDGKNRTRYPMAVCIHCRKISEEWVFGHGLPALESMRDQCVQATSAAHVRSILEKTRADLAASAESQPEVSYADDCDSGALARVLEQPQFFEGSGLQRDDTAAMHRLLYQIDRDMAAYKPVAGSRSGDRPSGDQSLRAKHIRVPAVGTSPKVNICDWLSVLHGQLAPQSPVLVIVPVGVAGGQWCDIIVGPPSESALKCLRTLPKGMPLATSIPYTIDPDFAESADRAIEQSRQGKDAAVQMQQQANAASAESAVASDQETAPPQSVPSGPAPNRASKTPGSAVKILGIVAALIVLAGVIVFAVFKEPTHTVEPLVVSESLETIQAADASWAASVHEPTLREALFDALRSDAELPGQDHLISTLRDTSGRLMDPHDVTEDAVVTAIMSEQNQIRAAVKSWLDAVADQADTLDARGWSSPADQLRTHSNIVTAHLNARQKDDSYDAGSFVNAISDVVEASTAAVHIESKVRNLEELAESLAKRTNGDQLIAGFGERLNLYLADAEGMEDLSVRIQDTRKIADDMGRAIDEHWADLDYSYFVQESGVYENAGGGLQVFRDWTAAVGDARFALQMDDPRDDDSLDDVLASLLKRVDSYGQCGELPTDLYQRHEALISAHAELMDQNWDGTRATAAKLAQDLDTVIHAVSALDADIADAIEDCLAECEARLVEAKSVDPTLNSAALQAAWQYHSEAIVHASDECQQRLMQINHLRQSLGKLANDIALPEDDHWDVLNIETELLRSIVTSKREAALDRVVQNVSRFEDPIDESFWQSEMSRYHQWLAESRELVRLFGSLQRQIQQLAPVEQLEQQYAELASHSLYGDVKVAVASVVEDLHIMREVNQHPFEQTAHRDALVKKIESEDLPLAVRMQAWRRLGNGGLADTGFVEQERRAAMALLPHLETLENDGEQWVARVQAEQRRRWIEHVNSVEDVNTLHEALASHIRFGVRRDDEDLEPRLRFNIDYHLIKRAISRALQNEDESRIERYIGSMREMVQSTRPESPDHEEVLGLIVTALDQIDSIDESPEPDFSRIGPGVAGWSAEVSSDGQVIRFVPPTHWQRVEGQELIFRRVDPTDAPPAYVATTEVSAGLFIDAATHRAEWSKLRDLFSMTHAADGRDMRRGPRVWDWQRATDSDSSMDVAECWLRELTDTSYSPELSVDRPSSRHPMQHVSAAAAMLVADLVGCRLPTYREWHAAYLEAGASAQIAEANLRRSDWQAQVLHYQEMGRLRVERPDEGSHSVAGGELQAAWDEQGSAEADIHDTLWFRTVESSDTFRDVVGNVAEFVYNRPETLMELTVDGLEAQELREMSESQLDELFIVGGSSLSRPSLQPQQLQTAPRPAQLRTFSDVGFRLAFSADSVAEASLSREKVLARFLDSRHYLMPVGSSAEGG